MVDFASALLSEGDHTVLGVQLFPPRLLVPVQELIAEATRVEAATRILAAGQPMGDWEVMLGSTAALFVRRPVDLEDTWEARSLFAGEAATVLNSIVCEMALGGAFFQPVSPVDLAGAVLLDNHAAVISGPHSILFAEAIQGPPLRLLAAPPFEPIDWGQTLEAAMSRRLSEISPQLPQAVAAAYFWHSQRQNVAALLNAWITCEQVLDHWWRQHIATIPAKERRNRLRDSRTYGSSVRIETLQGVGWLSDDLADALHIARQARNQLAHRATLTMDGTTQAMLTMKATLEKVLDQSLAAPSLGEWMHWG